ncbi:MAG: tyrosine-type recombinase/integrase [Candidatus Binatia bacterium]
MGRVFQRGHTFWIAYWHRGKEYRESAHTPHERPARTLLKQRLGECGRGTLIGPTAERVEFDALMADLIREYEVNGKRSIRSLRLSVRHLRAVFAGDRALDITTDRVRAYIAERRGEGASNASINRELSALRRAFTLAVQAGTLPGRPHIPMLEEHNARQGFLDHASFLALRAALPAYLQDPVTFLYESGWRVSEMRSLEWRDVDVAGRVVRLRPEVSKNKDGRLLPLAGALLALVERARDRRRLDCPFVFHADGKPVGDFKKSWHAARLAIGRPGLLVHDLRRTAVRNLVRSGTSETVAMALSGHKTRAVFDRYNIVSEQDLATAAQRLDAHLANQPVQTPVSVLPTAAKTGEESRTRTEHGQSAAAGSRSIR